MSAFSTAVTMSISFAGSTVKFSLDNILKPGFHSNAIFALRALHKRKPQVGKQPIMVAAASTEHSYWLALAFFFVA